MTTDTIETAAETLWQDYVRSTRRPVPRLAWQLEDVARLTVPTRVGNLAAWRVGEGPATLLVHGMADDHTIWGPMIDALRQRDMSFVTFDLPGHGLSDGDRITLSMAADAVTDIVAALGPITGIVGHSLGGLSTAVALSDGLAIDRAVLMSVTRYRRKRLIDLAIKHGADARVVERVVELHAERFGNDDLEANIPRIADRIAAEILLIHSLDDERVLHEDSAAAHEALGRSELWRPTGPDHRNTARDPAVVARTLDFLRR